MNKTLLRYVGIGAFMLLAFVLFMNKDSDTYPYRTEIRSLTQETQLSTEIFVGLYRAFETEGSYDLPGMLDQIERFDGYVDRYATLEGLPDEAMEDYDWIMTTLAQQQAAYDNIYQTAKAGEPIPGEYALALKEAVERRILYQGRLGRY